MIYYDTAMFDSVDRVMVTPCRGDVLRLRVHSSPNLTRGKEYVVARCERGKLGLPLLGTDGTQANFQTVTTSGIMTGMSFADVVMILTERDADNGEEWREAVFSDMSMWELVDRASTGGGQ